MERVNEFNRMHIRDKFKSEQLRRLLVGQVRDLISSKLRDKYDRAHFFIYHTLKIVYILLIRMIVKPVFSFGCYCFILQTGVVRCSKGRTEWCLYWTHSALGSGQDRQTWRPCRAQIWISLGHKWPRESESIAVERRSSSEGHRSATGIAGQPSHQSIIALRFLASTGVAAEP